MPVDRRPLACACGAGARLRPFSAWSAEPLLVRPVLGIEQLAPTAVEEIADDADDAGRIEDMHGWLPVLRSDANGSVRLDVVAPSMSSGRSRAAALHLLRDRDHLVEGRCDQPRESDDVAVLLDRDVENAVGGNHHPRGRSPRSRCSRGRRRRCSCRCRTSPFTCPQHDPGGRRALGLLGVHEGLEVRHRSLHARALFTTCGRNIFPTRTGRRRSSSRP